jgi:hypothetical protein
VDFGEISLKTLLWIYIYNQENTDYALLNTLAPKMHLLTGIYAEKPLPIAIWL